MDIVRATRQLKLTHDFVAAEMLKEGITVIGRYSANNKHMEVKCQNNHEYKLTWALFRLGTQCQKCRWEQHRLEFSKKVRQAFEKESYALLSEYVRSDVKLKFRCPVGHIHFIAWEKFKEGKRCAKCAGKAKDDHEKEVLRLKKNIRTKIRLKLKALQNSQRFNNSSLAVSLAVEIVDALGFLPDGYHLDHIVPQSWFDFTLPEEIKACWHPANLRYIPASENIKRKNKLTIEEVKLFNADQVRILAIASKKPAQWKNYASKPKQHTSDLHQLSINFLKVLPEEIRAYS